MHFISSICQVTKNSPISASKKAGDLIYQVFWTRNLRNILSQASEVPMEFKSATIAAGLYFHPMPNNYVTHAFFLSKRTFAPTPQ